MVMTRDQMRDYVDVACRQDFSKCVEAMCHVKHKDQDGNPIGQLISKPEAAQSLLKCAKKAEEEFNLIANAAQRGLPPVFFTDTSRHLSGDYHAVRAPEDGYFARVSTAKATANKAWASIYISSNPDVCPGPPPVASKVRHLSIVKAPVKEPGSEFISTPPQLGKNDIDPLGVNWSEGLKVLGWGLATVGTAALTVAAGSATVVAAACPFDGVVGEIVIGAGTIKAAALTGLSAGAFWISSRNFIASLF